MIPRRLSGVLTSSKLPNLPSSDPESSLIRPLSDRFPATAHWIYVDAVTEGLLPVTARDRAIEYLDAHLSANVTRAGGAWPQMAVDCRRLFAGLIGAGTDDVNLFSSFAGAAEALSRAVKPRQGGNIIVCTALSRPGIGFLWRDFALRHDLNVIELRLDEDPEFPLERLEGLLKSNTAMVVLPAVSHARGWRLPLAEIGALCRRRNIFFLADGTSSVGILELDVSASAVDGVVVAAHGNALGIHGVCFLFIDGFRLPRPGWFSGLTAGRTGARIDAIESGVRRSSAAGAPPHHCEEPHPISLVTAREALTVLAESGIRSIENHVLGLAARLRLALQELELPVDRPVNEQHCSHVVAVGAPAMLPDGEVATPSLAELAGHLSAGRVRFAVCSGQLQFGFHLYNRLRDVMDVRRVIAQSRAG